jgi:hypothetical protein
VRLVPVCVQLVREAHGPRVVPASDGAVEDLDLHARKATVSSPRSR